MQPGRLCCVPGRRRGETALLATIMKLQARFNRKFPLLLDWPRTDNKGGFSFQQGKAFLDDTTGIS